jgi:hypothetical protein
MKRIRILCLVPLLFAMASCIITTGGNTGGSGGLVADPAAGLDGLDHYRAVVTRTVEAQTADGPFEQKDQLSLAVWREEKAAFETIDAAQADGANLVLTIGRVDLATYILPSAKDGCQTFWDEENVEVDEASLTDYLYPLKSGSAAGEETVGGIAARVYDLNSDSLGVEGVEAGGKAWIAKDGGYLVKYQLELSGGDALFGSGATGKLTLEYELSEVNGDQPVAYPGDCRPVLADIPATDDAQDLQRMPGRLWYTSPSTPDQIKSFYEEYFSSQGWRKLSEIPLAGEDQGIFFSQESTGRSAMISLRLEGNGTTVDVLTQGDPGVEPAPSADETPSGGSDEPPNARIMTSLSDLLGSAETPGALPSYAMVVDLEWPASSGKIVTHLEAEVEGLNNHYVHTSGGETTEAMLFEGKEYEISGGVAELGSIGLRTDWILWQTDWLKVLMAAGLANPKAEPGTTLEGRAVEVYSVDGTDLPDMTGGILPVQITAMRGTIWVDQVTGALLKADLTFDADVKKSGQTEPAHDTGKFLLVVSRIGKVKITLG